MEGVDDACCTGCMGLRGGVMEGRSVLYLLHSLSRHPISFDSLCSFSGRFPTYIVTHSRSTCLHSSVTQT